MSGICARHAYKKRHQRGCEKCGACIFCPPHFCRSKQHQELHAGADRGRGKRGKAKQTDASNKPPRRSGRKRRGSSLSERLASFDRDLDDATAPVQVTTSDACETAAPILAPKTSSMAPTAHQLGGGIHLEDQSLQEPLKKRPRFVVKKGTLLTSLKMQNRCKEQLRRAAQRAMNDEASVICPEDPDLVKNMCAPSLGFLEEHLIRKVAKVAMDTTGITSEICYSLLASTTQTPRELTNMLEHVQEIHPEINIERTRVGRKRFATLKKKGEHIEQGQTAFLGRYYKQGIVHLKKENVRCALEWMQATLQLRPSKLRSFRVGDVLIANMPVLYLDNTYSACYKQYKKQIPEKQRIGQKIFYKLLKHLTDKTKAEAGLSYFYTDFLEVVAEAGNMMQRAAEIASAEALPARFKQRFDTLGEELKRVAHFVKHEFASHLEQDSTCANHCMRHALGGECNHEHTETCEECDAVNHLPELLEKAFEEVPESASAEFQTMKKAVQFVTEEFTRFSAHILRTKWQQKACDTEIAAAVQSEDTAVVIIDHKQKVLARRLKESQMQYYAKRGMSLLGAMVILGIDDPDNIEDELGNKGEKRGNDIEESGNDIEKRGDGRDHCNANREQHNDDAEQQKKRVQRHHFIDIIPDNTAEQKACITCACIEALLKDMKTRFPHIKKVCFQSDNAGPFSAATVAPFAHLLNLGIELPKIIGWTYTEAQSGKSMLDCHFAYVNIWIDAWVREGKGKNVLMDPPTLFKALAHDGGIQNSSTIRVELNLQSTYAIHSDSDDVRPNVLNQQEPGSHGIYLTGKKKGQPRPAIWKLKMGVRKCHTFSLGNNPAAYEQSGLEPEALPFHLLTRQTPITLRPKITESTKNDVTFGKKRAKKTKVPRMPSTGYVRRRSDDLVAAEFERLKNMVSTTPTLKPRRSTTSPITVPQRRHSWAQKASRGSRMIDVDVVQELASLYSVGVKNKTQKISSEAAFRQVSETIIKNRWDQRFLVTAGKVKSMFSQKKGPQLTKSQKNTLQLAKSAMSESSTASSSKTTPENFAIEDDNDSVIDWIQGHEIDILDLDYEIDREEEF